MSPARHRAERASERHFAVFLAGVLFGAGAVEGEAGGPVCPEPLRLPRLLRPLLLPRAAFRGYPFFGWQGLVGFCASFGNGLMFKSISPISLGESSCAGLSAA